MRLFIAIDLPQAIKEHLAFLQRSYPASCIKYTHPKQMHMTLNFLDEQTDIEAICALLHKVSFSAFSLRLSSFGVFPHEDNPRVVWVSVDLDPLLVAVQEKIDAVFTPKQSFKPHITLGRFRKQASVEEKQEALASLQQCAIKKLQFPVTHITLYKSTLTPLGPVYEVIERFSAKK